MCPPSWRCNAVTASHFFAGMPGQQRQGAGAGRLLQCKAHCCCNFVLWSTVLHSISRAERYPNFRRLLDTGGAAVLKPAANYFLFCSEDALKMLSCCRYTEWLPFHVVQVFLEISPSLFDLVKGLLFDIVHARCIVSAQKLLQLTNLQLMIGVLINLDALIISLIRGTPSVTFMDATPAKWKVFNVICVPGSPMD